MDDRRWTITPLDEDLPTPEEVEIGAAQTRQYFHRGLWFWLPVWETMGEPWFYPSLHVSHNSLRNGFGTGSEPLVLRVLHCH